jgi:DNA (cytosine-5)-methyltransferase 1
VKTFASLCSGFGLMDIGATQAGFQPIWGVEIDPKLAEVAAANLKHKIYVKSMVDFDWSKVDRPEHLHISPPCQNASIASHKGESGIDIALANACCEAIEILQPDSFTLENVRGYQRFQGYQKIVDTLWGLNYWVNASVLNAADFGVPQRRDRLILRAVKCGFPALLPQPEIHSGWFSAVEDLIPDFEDSEFAEWQLRLMPELYASMLTDSAVNSRRMATCLRPSKTPTAFLVSGTANNSRDVTVVDGRNVAMCVTASISRRPLRSWLDGGRVVKLNSRAIARLQTLPDWYQIPGNNALAGKGIGNGVPCLMARKILETIA